MNSLRVDHVIYAVNELEAAATRFAEELGLASVEGGRHPGWGTENRIVPLGETYVELVTVVDREEAASSDFGRPVLEALARREQLVGWAVATDDIQSIARRLNLEVTHGSRKRTDGTTLSWHLAGLGRLETGAFPVFIEWDGPAELYPGAANAAHRLTPTGIAWIEVAAEEQSMREWLGDIDFPLRITDGGPALSAVAIATDEGEIVLM